MLLILMTHSSYCLLLLCLLRAAAATPATITVATPAGEVVGSAHETHERFGYIPYARAPVGDLRWAAPEPLLRFPGEPAIHDGSRADYRPACPQPKKPLVDQGSSDDQDEDCLFIYVWRPAGTVATANLPVAVFTHGGAHFQGSGTDMYVDGKRLAMDGVILVTVNYRLGLLGFMNDVSAPSHPSTVTPVAGILDNLEALRFVQRTIGSFGGDPNKVTVFGESAGGSNGVFLLTSASMVERDERLFRRIVLMSPSHMHFDIMPVEDELPQTLSALMGCPDPSQDSAAAWACLRSKTWEEIWSQLPPQGASRIQFLMTMSPAYSGLQGLTTVQPKFARDHPAHRRDLGDRGPEWPAPPMKRVRAGLVAKGVDIIIGQTKDEGSLFAKLAFMVRSTADLEFFENMMQAGLGEGKMRETKALIQYYKDRARDTNVWDAQVEFVGDLMFSVGVHLMLSLIAKLNPETKLYSYVFSYEPEHGASFLGQNMGAAHGLELQFVFDALHKSGLYGTLDMSEANARVATRMRKIFVDFIKTGTSDCLEQYSDDERPFCEITPKGDERVIRGFKKEGMDRWDAWMSTAPGHWASWGPKGEYAHEPTLSWLLNHVLITELILLGEDVRRMVLYGGLVVAAIWGCCGGSGGCRREKKMKKKKG
jgi:carboxylesterase type B